MNLNKMTEKSQAAILEAQNLAIEYGHQEVGELHMLLNLFFAFFRLFFLTVKTYVTL